jgi:hypothetical protein
MRAVLAIAVMSVAVATSAADPEEARIEQLMSAPAKAATTAKPDKKAAAKTDADSVSSLVGQRVTVETRLRGVYLGTLTAVTRDALTLAIELPTRSLSYTLPRGDVASVTPR